MRDERLNTALPYTKVTMTKQLLASIGDEGVLNAMLPLSLSEVWIDRDMSWLNFNERVLAEALDSRTPLL
jgi:polyphosphate kinase